jgi:hypothetical protein
LKSNLKGRFEPVDCSRKSETENCRVQDKQIERRKSVQKFGGKTSDGDETAEIELHRNTSRVRSLTPNFAGCLLGLVEVAAGKDHLAAVQGQAPADLEPDPGVGAGDDSDSS